MAFSLIDETEGAVPIAALTKTEFPAWREKAPERERNWMASIGFSAEAGKHALLPGESGKLARVPGVSLPSSPTSPGSAR